MELAQTAKEPYNYFLLLRALFRSIGGGSHDLLYQEFLPLLPNLLQGRAIPLFPCPVSDLFMWILVIKLYYVIKKQTSKPQSPNSDK